MAVLIGGSVMVPIGLMLLALAEDDRRQRRQGASHPDIDQVGVPRPRMLRAKPGICSGWSPGQLAAVLVSASARLAAPTRCEMRMTSARVLWRVRWVITC
jgi:hypothetical protein